MKIYNYIKQRWYYFTINLVLIIFLLLLCWASDTSVKIDFSYIISAFVIANIVFIIIDYLHINHRINCMRSYILNNAASELQNENPIDTEYAKIIKELILSHNNYKEHVTHEHNKELEFITKWVHDVKVPISATKLLIDNMTSEESTQIEMQLSYIDQNIQKILYHIKSKSFHEDFRIRPASIKSIVNTALKSYAVFFSYKSISLNIDIADVMVETDEKWSTYIVSQLISNAIKYTYNNGRIDIYTIEKDNTISLHLKNTGQGINKADLKSIFSRGYSGYSIRKEKSTGYGLYLSKHLADIMGHKLTAESIEGEYAEFIITFTKTGYDIHITKV